MTEEKICPIMSRPVINDMHEVECKKERCMAYIPEKKEFIPGDPKWFGQEGKDRTITFPAYCSLCKGGNPWNLIGGTT